MRALFGGGRVAGLSCRVPKTDVAVEEDDGTEEDEDEEESGTAGAEEEEAEFEETDEDAAATGGFTSIEGVQDLSFNINAAL